MKKTADTCLQYQVYNWLSSMEGAHIKKQNREISFQNEFYEGIICFYENHILELSILDKETGEISFYLHFEIRKMENVKNNVQAFLEFFNKNQVKELLDVKEITKGSKPIKLLISCTSGLTSTYFAYKIKNLMEKAGVKILVDAASFIEISKLYDKYDCILLAPQIAYKLSEYQREYGSKVMAIESMDFATYDVNRVINKILPVLLA